MGAPRGVESGNIFQVHNGVKFKSGVISLNKQQGEEKGTAGKGSVVCKSLELRTHTASLGNSKQWGKGEEHGRSWGCSQCTVGKHHHRLPSNTQVRGLQVHPQFCPSQSCPISNRSGPSVPLNFFTPLASFPATHLLQVLPVSCVNTIVCGDCLLSVASPLVHSRLSGGAIFQQRGFRSPRNNPRFLPSPAYSKLPENNFIPIFCFIL